MGSVGLLLSHADGQFFDHTPGTHLHPSNDVILKPQYKEWPLIRFGIPIEAILI